MRRQMRPPPRVSPLLQQHFLMDAQVENQQGRSQSRNNRYLIAHLPSLSYMAGELTSILRLMGAGTFGCHT